MKKLSCAAVAILLTGSALSSYVEYTWCGQGADNNWETKANWEGGKVPEGWDYAVFPPGDWTVNLTKDKSSCGIRLAEGSGKLTLTGSATVTAVNYGGEKEKSCLPAHIVVSAGRELVVDGPQLVNFRHYDQQGVVRIKQGKIGLAYSVKAGLSWKHIIGDAKFYLDGGDFTSEGSYLYISNRAEVVIREGDFFCKEGYDFSGESHMLMVGGTLHTQNPYYTVYTLSGNSTCDFLGGTVHWMNSSGSAANMQGREFGKMAPKKGATLIFPKGPGTALLLPAKSSFAGTVYATNRTDATVGGINAGSWPEVTGGGTLYANRIDASVSANEKSVNWDLGALYLGAGGFVQNNHWNTHYHLRNGNKIGVFADCPIFTAYPGNTFYLYFHGPLSFDTLNCFGDLDENTGKVKTHTITAKVVRLTDVNDFRATGGGTVDLTPYTVTDAKGGYDSYEPGQLRSIDIAAGTTVAFNDCRYRLKVMNLRMGENATLKLDLSHKSYVDAAGVAEFGAGAKIVVTRLPAELVSGTFYPICMVPAKKGASAYAFPAFELPDDAPAGWSVATTANAAYLTDGVLTSATSGTSPYWTGLGEDNLFSTAANWNEKVPTSGQAPHFYGTTNTEIDTGATARQFQNWFLHTKTAPFAFRGGNLTFGVPNDKSTWEDIFYSIRTDGDLPTVVENDVGVSSGTHSLGLMMQAHQQGSLSLLGNSIDTVPLQFGGDVRIGGNWTATKVGCTPSYGSSVVAVGRSRLTVMPGAKLTVTAQSGSQHMTRQGYPQGDFFYAVATNGEMTVDGSDFTFERAATHFVDGTLTVNCPLATAAEQWFYGDGTLKLRGGFADNTTGSVKVEGRMTFVPSDWDKNLPLSVKGEVTIAPETDWTYGAETNLVLDGNSALTLATGGHVLTFASPVVSDGEIVVTGGGRLLLGAAGTKLWTLSCADGATVGATDELLAANAGADKYADVLRVRKLDDSLVFAEDLKTRMRYESETDTYVFSAKRKLGLMLIVR